jgi:hypothetical protein
LFFVSWYYSFPAFSFGGRRGVFSGKRKTSFPSFSRTKAALNRLPFLDVHFFISCRLAGYQQFQVSGGNLSADDFFPN